VLDPATLTARGEALRLPVADPSRQQPAGGSSGSPGDAAAATALPSSFAADWPPFFGSILSMRAPSHLGPGSTAVRNLLPTFTAAPLGPQGSRAGGFVGYPWHAMPGGPHSAAHYHHQQRGAGALGAGVVPAGAYGPPLPSSVLLLFPALPVLLTPPTAAERILMRVRAGVKGSVGG
jgi:hypothetical protein